MGLRPGEPVGDLLHVLGVAFSAEPTRSYRVHLPDRRLDIVADPARFVEASLAAFPAAEGGSAAGQRRFWRLQEAVGRRSVRRRGERPAAAGARPPATWSTTSASSDSAGCWPPRRRR